MTITQRYDPKLAASITSKAQKILLSMSGQFYPTLVASQIMGVQPMTGDVGSIFTMQATYTPKPKYKFSRAKWYVAEYDWVHYGEVIAWCAEQFGPHPRQHDAWSRWWDRYEGKVFFRDQEDYMMFKLRWGE